MKTRWAGGWAAIVMVGATATATAGSIDVGTPLISGELSRFADHQERGRASLSADQLQAFSTWLERHRSGWQGMLTEASLQPGQLEWTLKHRDGATTRIDVTTNAKGGHQLLLTGPGQWAYRSFGGLFKSWAAIRVLSDQELAALEKMAGAG